MARKPRKYKHRATKRQLELMQLILKGDGTGWLDMDQLIDKLEATSSVGSKQSIQCSIRILEGHNLLTRAYETRRGKVRVLMVPTGKAFVQFKA